MRYFRKPQIHVEIICRNSGLTMCESLLSYTELIKQLPYKRMCYDKTRMTTWNSFKEDKVFGPFFHNVFNTRETVKFSREELFTIVNTTEFSNAIFSIVLWGYPRGYTMGMNMKKLFQKLIDNLPILKDEIWVNRNFTRDEFNNCFNKIIFEDTGIGVSTLTKFLYFFKIKIEGYALNPGGVQIFLSNLRSSELIKSPTLKLNSPEGGKIAFNIEGPTGLVN